MEYTAEQRKQLIQDAGRKVVKELQFTEPENGRPGYWTLVFTDNSEMSFRFMAELT